MLALADIPDNGLLLVMTNVRLSQSGYTWGRDLKKNWKHHDVAKVGGSVVGCVGWLRVMLPNDEYCLVKILSSDDQSGSRRDRTKRTAQIPMNTETATGGTPAAAKPARKAPPKATPPAAAPSAAKTPAAKTPAAKPAAAPKPSPAAKPAAPSASTETSGKQPYPWLLNRLKSTIVKKAKADVQPEVRKAMKGVTTFAGALKEGVKHGVFTTPVADIPDEYLKFLNKFTAEAVSGSAE